MDSSGESDVQQSEVAAGSKFDPRMYKTSLCNFYLQGICKNGDKCPFAHGTLDLRVAGMSESVKSSSSTVDKRKTLCVKFVANGICPWGTNCEYAHSVNEVKAAIEADKFGNNQSSNPLYKTSLCHNYMTGLFCEFADRCQYAHGRHELRPFKIEKLTTEVKQSRLEHLRQMPAEKCDNLPRIRENPARKTIMCKNLANCKFGLGCNFAHSPSELAQNAPMMATSSTIPCRNILQQGFCARGRSCKFDHNVMCQQPGAFTTPPKQGPMCPSMLDIGYCVEGKAYCNFAHSEQNVYNPWLETKGQNQKYKSVVCKNWQSGSCKFGTNCNYAHGNQDLRAADGLPNLAVAAIRPRESSQTAAANNKFKVVLCNFFTQKGYCKNGSSCSFAHGTSELRVPYKTALCKNYSANKQCPQGECCVFAHGQEELITSENDSNSNVSKIAESSGIEGRVIKRRRCVNFSAFGKCPDVDCEFIHGPDQEESNELPEEGLENKRPRQI